MIINTQQQSDLFGFIRNLGQLNSQQQVQMPTNINITINGDATEENIDDMITKMQNLFSAANYRGINIMEGVA